MGRCSTSPVASPVSGQQQGAPGRVLACRRVCSGKKSPVQEGGHLPAGDGVVGTEQGVGGRVAASGDPGGGEPGDVVLEEVAVGVVEGRGGVAEAQPSG